VENITPLAPFLQVLDETRLIKNKEVAVLPADLVRVFVETYKLDLGLVFEGVLFLGLAPLGDELLGTPMEVGLKGGDDDLLHVGEKGGGVLDLSLGHETRRPHL
jgi:hypothetical protein